MNSAWGVDDGEVSKKDVSRFFRYAASGKDHAKYGVHTRQIAPDSYKARTDLPPKAAPAPAKKSRKKGYLIAAGATGAGAAGGSAWAIRRKGKK